MRKTDMAVILSLLVYYLAVCVFAVEPTLKNDEGRYLGYADNLTKGFYAPTDSKVLWNGPGYPMVVSMFLFLDLPFTAAKFFNAFFLWGAVIFFWLTTKFYTGPTKAIICAAIFGLYPPFLPQMPQLLTEALSVFLASGFMYFLVKTFRTRRTNALVLACFFGGYLILTKVMFAYVFVSLAAVSALAAVWRREHLKTSVICVGCLGVCVPYLVYTYRLTGNVFYWANSGGSTLYWMSSPYANEWGDWRNEQRALADERYSHHHEFLRELITKDYVERDMMYKKKAVENIRQHPQSYAFNWIANQGRFWLDYPFAYKYQRPHTLFYMIPNALLMGALVFTVPLLLMHRRRLPAEILALCLFALLFIAGSSLVYSCARYLITIVPALLAVVFYTWTSLVTVRLRENIR